MATLESRTASLASLSDSTRVGPRRTAVLAGETTVTEVTEEALARAEALEGRGVMRHLCRREARDDAAALDALVRHEGPTAAARRPLLGTLVTVKELIPVAAAPHNPGGAGG